MLKNLFFNERKRALKIKNYGKKELELSIICCYNVSFDYNSEDKFQSIAFNRKYFSWTSRSNLKYFKN